MPLQTKNHYTNLDKLYWPKDGYTKGDMLEYYEKIAPFMLPYLKNRPTALNRFPDGIAGIHFFQKNVREKLPMFVQTITLKAKTTGKSVRYVMCNNMETLLWLANFGAIELHPWNSRKGSLTSPDYIIFDLDPGPESSFGAVIKTAQEIHRVLDARKIKKFVKTSGKRGLHVYLPTRGRYSYKQAQVFARSIAEEVVQKIPEIASVEHWPKNREDKVFIDIMRNAIGQTTVAPYCLRPVLGATVSTPIPWNEVKRGLDPKKFTIETIFKRLKKRGDIWRTRFVCSLWDSNEN